MPDTIRIAVVGLGLVGQRHAEVILRDPHAQWVGAVDPGQGARDFAQNQSVPCFESVEAMLGAVRPDGVILATPTPMHVDQALTCVEAGVPVLVEKPLAVTSEEGARLVRAAEAADVPLLVGHHRRYNPLVHRAQQVIGSGQIGDIRAVHGTCWFYKPDSYFDTTPWRKQRGAGPISVNVVHDVDLMRAFCGEVTSVRAVAAPSRRGHENEDVAAAILEFESGAIGTLTLSDSIAAPWSWEMTAQENGAYPATPESCYMIGGSKGSLSIPDLRVWTHEGADPDWWTPISAASLPRERSDPLANQLDHFREVIRGQARPLVSGLEGLKTLKVVEAIQISASSGEAVTLT